MDKERVPYLGVCALALLPLAAGVWSELAPSQVGVLPITVTAGTMGPMQLVAFHHYALYFEACLPPSAAGYDFEGSIGQPNGSPFVGGRWQFRAPEGGCRVRSLMMAFEPPTTGNFEVWWSASANMNGTGAVLVMQESLFAPGAGVVVGGFGFVVLGLAAALDVRRAAIAKRAPRPSPFAGRPVPPVVTVLCPRCGYPCGPPYSVCPNCWLVLQGR